MFSAVIGLFMQFLAFLGLAGATSPQTAVTQSAPNSASTQVDSGYIYPDQISGTTATATKSVSPSTQVPSSAPPLPTGSAWLSSVPLGDGKYVTDGPKKGYIYLCHIMSGGQGAQVNGPWIHGEVWDPSEKISVQGSVAWPQASYTMKVSGSTRVITSDDLPTDHTTGAFPISASDPAAFYDRNGSSIVAHTESYSLPAHPSAATSPDCIYGAVGVMIDGVALLDGFDALYRDALAHEEQDKYEGHPNNDIGYHYHGFETGYVTSPVSSVVGYAFDGFPITGSKLSNGNYLHTADLDECHGITSAITLDGKQVTTYHYVLTQDFPYSVSCFKGRSYEPKPGGGQAQGQAQSQSQTGQSAQVGGQTPPQEAISACTSKSDGASCSFSTPNGILNGVCHTPPAQESEACVPQR